ncbi:hypothetical protein SAMN06297129_2555 [Pseudooceanicola antarcticus]|uniref:Uncharacterized protein n=1 Tax=Pseudooceanicola antarcticus TaxID=1247613 RepID=A0A285IZ33_9RHOB|nr:DUF6477 family protein [Pseudooceanicola antarcticus]PJE25670.1 hypothetical protein CVM39_18320 [Pseudooceanicola antarcticus]SNY53319.1 hypothetical protein SAMN06297129_2555 [Pseudooceanicola antarcticus]
MQDIHAMLGQLKRPKLLVGAARQLAEDYQRERHLPPLLGQPAPRRHGAAALDLLEREAELDDQRRIGAGTYSPQRHIRLLAALIGEARLVSAASRTPEG